MTEFMKVISAAGSPLETIPAPEKLPPPPSKVEILSPPPSKVEILSPPPSKVEILLQKVQTFKFKGQEILVGSKLSIINHVILLN